MSWRDKVQALREGANSQKCLNPSLPKPPKPGSVSFGSTPPAPFQEKTGFSGQPFNPAGVVQNLSKPDFSLAANDPAAPELESQPCTEPPEPPEPPVPAKPKKQTFMEWQDTWCELDQAYQRHHVNCPFCIAAGKGYGLRCGTGAALYTAYEAKF